MIVTDNNKQSICHTAKKLELKIRDKKILKRHTINCIYFKKQ